MSINYSAVVVVGLPYRELAASTTLTTDELDDMIVYSDLDQVIPNIGGGREDAIIGAIVLKSGYYDYTDVGSKQELDRGIDLAVEEFKTLTGAQPRLFISPLGE